ncbi:MAG: vWA domain-containing protein [Myxococcaceae bacterium]
MRTPRCSAVLALALLLPLLQTSCIPCGAFTCAGCCAGGECREGTAESQCGKGGVQCDRCAAPARCSAGACRGKPNALVVLDTSESMIFAADPTSSPECAACANSSCLWTGCARTRIADVAVAMKTFLAGPAATSARFGLVPFPVNLACEAPAFSTFPTAGVALPTTDSETYLEAAATKVYKKIPALNPFGGRPTGATLAALSSYAPLNTTDREQFIVLVTDGAPNCNAVLDPTSCRCTPAAVAPCGAADRCLDQDRAVAALTTLREKGIRTFVVGFGAEAASSTSLTAEALSAMALAGGFERRCPGGDADCGGIADSCVTATRLCELPYFQAVDGAALTRVLEHIGEHLQR